MHQVPLSNLISLADLTVSDCGNLRSEGLWPLVAHGCLTGLHIYGAPKFFTGSEPSRPHDQQSSSKLWNLHTGKVAGVPTASICSFLSSSLTRLSFVGDAKVERFRGARGGPSPAHLPHGARVLVVHQAAAPPWSAIQAYQTQQITDHGLSSHPVAAQGRPYRDLCKN